MKALLLFFTLGLLPGSALATVRVSIQETNGWANLNYECTAGETVRAFALNVTVDRGVILGVTNFFRGPSTASAQGYGIFPASVRDNLTVASGTSANWTTNTYTPLAVPADNPAGTLGGLNTSGVTLEFAALWDPSVAAAAPPARGTLCALQISQTANVSVAANSSRGGILAAPSDILLTPQYIGALVGPIITSATLENGVMTVRFQDGELESAPAINGPWTGTGNRSGSYTETVGTAGARFYRVHNH